MKRSTRYFLILIVLGGALFFVNNGRWDLWDPDEPRYAEVAREMVNSGDWILMHLNGKVYGDKPPLFFWLIGLSSYLWGGFTSFAVRFAPALFGTLTVLLTFFLGKNLYSPRTGFLSGLILATSVEFIYLSTRANIDTTLAFFTTASLFCFIQWSRYNLPRPSPLLNGVRAPWITRININGRAIYGFYVTMALATLAKGPVGFILPLLVSLIYLSLQKKWKTIKEMRLLTGMLLFVVIVLCWYVPAVLKGGNLYLKETLFKHTVDAYAKGWTHVRPFYYYFVNFPIDFLPWFLFLPGAIVMGLSKKKKERPEEFLFLLIWFLSIFLFFSFSKGKRPIYLLPIYPAASILVGRFWDTYLSSPHRRSVREVWISLPIYFFIGLFFFMGMILYLLPAVANLPVGPSPSKMLGLIIKAAGNGAKYLSYVSRESIIPLIYLLLGSGILLSLTHGFQYKSVVFTLIVATVAIGFFYGTRFIFPKVDPYKSARFFSQEIQRIMKPGDKLAMYGGFAVGPYNFYTGIVPIEDIEHEEEIVSLFRSKERVFCLIQNHEYEALRKKDFRISLNLVTRRKVGGKDIVLASNQ
jgi:4-amino-4-deoxy-L-arabinose transferase-like glycosyltransferase